MREIVDYGVGVDSMPFNQPLAFRPVNTYFGSRGNTVIGLPVSQAVGRYGNEETGSRWC